MYIADSHHGTKILWWDFFMPKSQNENSVAQLPGLDSRYTIGPDGALTVKNLELGAAARKEDTK